MFVLGMDIGYSNLKIAFGDAAKGAPFTVNLPAIAAPASMVANTLFGDTVSESDGSGDGVRVMVKDEPWIAGLPPSAVQRHSRELHEGYVGSPSWTALAYAGMVLAGENKIDLLVVGLPVHHFEEKSYRDKLRALLKGTHQVSAKRKVEVLRVEVVPQPIGAFLDAIQWYPNAAMLEEETILTLDPGYFSTDWAMIQPGSRYAKEASGSSLNAMSRLIETARSEMAKDFGMAPSQTQVEDAIRQQRTQLRVFSDVVDLAPYLEMAAQSVAVQSLTELRASIRHVNVPITYLLLSGGGAAIYKSAAETVFPKSEVLISEDPTLANARGFWNFHMALADESAK
jgi:plasmid segregation protein ParM